MFFLLFLAAFFLAYSNGANDNFKGVASLFGSRTANYRTAIVWATVTTFAGSVCSIFAAQSLLMAFSGRGLVPERIAASEHFVLSVAIAAAITVVVATRFGFPISTTHAIIGAIIGSGLLAAGGQVDFRSLERSFLVPLLLSPVLAVILAAILYALLGWVRERIGVAKEWCLCVGESRNIVVGVQPASTLTLQTAAAPALEISTGTPSECFERYAGRFLGIEAQRALDGLHFLSAGVVSFARGLNDTPKIAAILLVAIALHIRVGVLALAFAMAVGGLWNARRVAETMSLKITSMNSGQGLTANLATGALVILASTLGLPVSTTHVSVGALFGIGIMRGRANTAVIRDIALAWVLTLPCAAVAGGIVWLIAGKM